MKHDDDQTSYKHAKKNTKRDVAQGKVTSDDDFYAKLETASDDKEIFKITKQRLKNSMDVKSSKFVFIYAVGTLLTANVDIKERWKEYCSKLLNETFPSEDLLDIPTNEGSIPCMSTIEVHLAINGMAHNKAPGLDDIASDGGSNCKVPVLCSSQDSSMQF